MLREIEERLTSGGGTSRQWALLVRTLDDIGMVEESGRAADAARLHLVELAPSGDNAGIAIQEQATGER